MLKCYVPGTHIPKMIPRMRPPLLFLLLAALCCFLAAALDPDADVKVTVYEGPTECDNKPARGKKKNDEDESLERVIPDSIVGLHFTVYVDESTVGSRETAGLRVESSHDKGVAPSFPVGQGRVIPGLDRGLIGLCRNSKATIIVPPYLGYGPYGKPEQGVGPHATLRYDVEIVDIKPPVPNEFKKIDADGDWRISRKEAKSYFKKIGQGVNLDSLWSEEDDDGDGYISWEEFKGAKGSEEPPSVRQRELEKRQKEEMEKAQQKQKLAERREKKAREREKKARDAEAAKILDMYSLMDDDGDGKLSREELGTMFKQYGQEMTDEFWEESDPDGDGYVTFEEFVGDAGKGTKKKEDKRKSDGKKELEEGSSGGDDIIDMDEL